MKKEKPVGLTEDTGYQIGVRRTLDLGSDDAWDLLLSKEGLKLWLGNISPSRLEIKKAFRLNDVEGMMRVVKSYSHFRMSWKRQAWKNMSLLQVRVIKAGKKSTISFHQDHLADNEQREQMKEHWEDVLTSLEHFIPESRIIKSCYAHLGGKFGNRLAERFEELEWITRDTESKNFIITAKGEQEFRKLGIDVSNL